MTVPLIDTPEALAALCRDLASASWIALDTEFVREETFYAQLCLIQVATADRVTCIDPLAVPDLTPLLGLLADPAIIKVFHAAGQDLEIFSGLMPHPPAPVFDTQLAATLLGHGEQIGYAALVERDLGVVLDKSQSRTDWRQRPLTAEQLAYAADDVRYLAQLYPAQRDMLRSKNREQWLDEDFAALSDPARYLLDPEHAWRKVKGSAQLKGVQLAVLAELATWREHRARDTNRPRRWVLSDEVMIDLSRQMPQQATALGRLRGLPPAVRERHGDTLLTCIARGRARAREDWPKLPIRRRLDAQMEPTVDLLLAVIREAGNQHDISAPTLGGRKDVEALILDDPDCALCHGWRERIVGATLRRLLAGEGVISVRDKRIRLSFESTA